MAMTSHWVRVSRAVGLVEAEDMEKRIMGTNSQGKLTPLVRFAGALEQAENF